ncbi:hypothetical protein RHGRI_019057 [Rhododendron griersonianum]|uniref:Uncharacterized protein n=1 Tax=Rhododendron griersonianum TaxID=479676 RepID=A0AAV6JEF9_9ERIC|nr:hypothetical protein RHGRI_019057 [Rhododendron griersonianum]
MKSDTKEPESLLCDQGMRYHHSYTKTLPKYSVWFLLFVTLAYFFYSVLLISPLNLYNQNPSFLSRQSIISLPIQKDGALIQNPKTLEKTQLRHIVFGIAASSNLWHRRKSYIKLWWKPKEMRGFVWLDKPVKNNSDDQNTLPPLKISGSTKNFKYTNSKGSRSAIRISRIVSETVRLGLQDARWIVMGDDDTFFVAENLFDVYGNLLGLLTAHPIAPLVSLHHLDVVDPIFPYVNRVQALQRLKVPMKLDSAGLMQQSICYDKSKGWTVSVSWGYAVQIFRSKISAREMEKPQRTFVNWHMSSDSNTGFAFNTRPFIRNPCQRPNLYMLSNALFNPSTNRTASEYVKSRALGLECKQNKAGPFGIHRVVVYKKPDPYLWDKARRRNCCRILPSKKTGTLRIDVGDCGESEIIQ